MLCCGVTVTDFFVTFCEPFQHSQDVFVVDGAHFMSNV